MQQYKHYETEGADAAAPEGALAMFDYQLDRFEKDLAALRDRIGPVLIQYAGADAKVSEPRPEPQSHLHGRVERLRFLIDALDDVIGEVVL